MSNEPNEGRSGAGTPEANEAQAGATAPGASEPEIIEGHEYDGIREYDNPMPGWWVWIFVVSVIFAPAYVLGIYVFDVIDTYEEDLAEGQAELIAVREAYEAANPTFVADSTALAAYTGVQEHIQAGAALYATNCAVCHGAAGQGLIGPNLTDPYWIHGNQPTDVFEVISKGVLEKGMTPWENILTPEERAQLVAFVASLEGTNPDNPKAPQGDPVDA